MPTALIADDERLMRDQLRSALTEVWPALDIIAEAKNGDEAVQLAAELKPDVAFLDIRMPGRTGLEAAQAVSEHSHIVFVTAYDQHAVDAFERGATDYLLKPVEPARLALTVERLRKRIETQTLPGLDQALLRLSRELGNNRKPYLQWIQAGAGNTLRMIPTQDILFLTSDEKYTRIQTGEHEALIRKPIRELVQELDPDQFWQIHRATLVRVTAIESVIRDDRGRLLVCIKDRADKLEVSRSFTHLFKQM